MSGKSGKKIINTQIQRTNTRSFTRFKIKFVTYQVHVSYEEAADSNSKTLYSISTNLTRKERRREKKLAIEV